MKLSTLLIFIFCLNLTAKSQDLDEKTASIIAEGRLLYHSEMASWYGTDVLQARFKSKAAGAGGYFSYSDGEQNKCVFFDRKEIPAPLITFIFDASYNVNSVKVDTSQRNFTPTELELFTIRQAALRAIKTDTIFKMYNNTNLNVIPLVSNEDKKVYVLTAPTINGVVVFGNDYLLNFDRSSQLLNIKRLHKNIIPVNYTGELAETTHSHLPETGDFITATDICTLMLYGKTANWKNHIVVSEKYASIWDCQKQSLTVITRGHEKNR
ncbi:hypothetical protein [Pedobacter frigoris]|uniref:hypothetical protein n=1 Tax=Pedobacter frigoris TaxID=2571272 RepID=UPI0029304727|nr:hypothetical protein [Pedobacter frigoris]